MGNLQVVLRVKDLGSIAHSVKLPDKATLLFHCDHLVVVESGKPALPVMS